MRDDDEGRTVRPAADWLREQRNGALHAELGEALQEVTAAVLEQRKAGTITVKITVAPMNASGMVSVTDDVTSKPPLPARGSAFYYADADCNLRREDPAQLKFNSIREVVGSDDVVREIAAAAD